MNINTYPILETIFLVVVIARVIFPLGYLDFPSYVQKASVQTSYKTKTTFMRVCTN